MNASKTDITDVHVTDSPDMDEVATTLCRAFADDPVIRWTFPAHLGDRARYLDRFFRITTQMMLDDGGRVAHSPGYEGVLVWSGVVDESVDDEDDDSLGFLEQECGPFGPRVGALMRSLGERHPTGLPRHVHGLFFAVRPESRSIQLIHAILMGGALPWLAEHDASWYGEASSPEALRLWHMLGCERLGEEIVLPDGGPALYPIFWTAGRG